ncbi:MAG: alpha-amylase family glycosyl hydrolase [Ardenticatenaceae bacterium]|nr:alpha-amylase family glycosyl hydrolase [Ardenticatenaceae bacterium]
MKYTISRLPAVSLLLLLLFLFGCSDNQPQPDTTPDVESEPTESAEAPTEEEVTADSEPAAGIESDNLHVPSPAWEEQIIYFIMTDRFNDGDPSNNDQGQNEYDPQDERKYQGGDLAGIVDQLDYIEGLGATTIWITPPVANQWWDPQFSFGGYHGYWAENFKEVDAHLGSLEDYQALSRALHGRDMYLIQDIVVNHTGNFFTYDGEFDPLQPEQNFVLNSASVPVTAPTQPPFNLNDVTNPDHVEADIYHWTPTITNFDNDSERRLFQLADLDDLDTKNPVVRQALRDSFGYWIREVGVDGFRIDTIIYVEDEFWEDFHYADDADAPGIDLVAAETGRDNFLSFGEAFIGADPLDDTTDQQLAAYAHTADQPGMDTVLNFPLHFDMRRVFAEGQPTNFLTYRVSKALEHYPNPYVVPNFIDNHDVARFLSAGSTAGLEQATLFLMTVPGIPVIYYGTEQGFSDQRASMFATGWGSDGEDHFNPDTPLYQHISRLAEIRLSNPVFTRGSFEPLLDSADGPGVLAYKRSYEGEQAVVIINTADQPVLMAGLDTGLPAGSVLTNLYGLGEQEDLVVGGDGLITRELAAREALILMVSDETKPVESFDTNFSTENDIEGLVLSEDTLLSGTVNAPGAALRLIIDGNIAASIDTTADETGRWSAAIPINRFPPGTTEHTLQFYVPEVAFVSETYSFSTETPTFDVQVVIEDPAGDDKGPNGVYVMPQDSTFGQQMDIRGLAVEAPGPDLIVNLTMEEVTDVWGPFNGFDHVLFHIYIDLPGLEGTSLLPRINATAPDGFTWDYMAFVEGWNNRLYSASGATPTEYGAPASPPPEIAVDMESNTITMTFSGASLGNPVSYEGAQVYVTTWDWNGPDAAYRPLGETAGTWTFGGGDGDVDPLIADEAGPLTLSE